MVAARGHVAPSGVTPFRIVKAGTSVHADSPEVEVTAALDAALPAFSPAQGAALRAVVDAVTRLARKGAEPAAELLTREEAAKRLGMSKATLVRRLAEPGSLLVEVQDGPRLIRITAASVEAFRAARMVSR